MSFPNDYDVFSSDHACREECGEPLSPGLMPTLAAMLSRPLPAGPAGSELAAIGLLCDGAHRRLTPRCRCRRFLSTRSTTPPLARSCPSRASRLPYNIAGPRPLLLLTPRGRGCPVSLSSTSGRSSCRVHAQAAIQGHRREEDSPRHRPAARQRRQAVETAVLFVDRGGSTALHTEAISESLRQSTRVPG